MNKKRYAFIDTWRGLVIVMMVIYHLLYDMKFMFNYKLEFFTIESWYFFQQFICWSFIFLAGFSTNLSRNPRKNGIKVFVAALLLSLITYFVVPDFMIKFGVLHLIGLSIILVSFFSKGEKSFSLVKGILAFGLFFFIWKHGLRYFSFYGPLAEKGFLFPLGFPGPNFSSSDYFPLLPWFFLFLAGYYVGNYNKYKMNFLSNINLSIRPLEFLGKRSLAIYMVHQVLIYGLLTIIEYFS